MTAKQRAAAKRAMKTVGIHNSRNWQQRGGKLADISLPHVRYYDDKRRKRYVELTIMRYWGFGNHYYVKLKEDDNPIAKADTNTDGVIGTRWMSAWDDPKSEGRCFERKFNTRFAAQNWIDATMQKEFPGMKTVWLRSNVESRWFYGSGD